MNAFADLNTENHGQIRNYLRFFRQKKEGIIRDIEREFHHIKDDRLHENMFTKEDMIEYSDFILSSIQSHVSHDMGSIINMGALAINQMLLSSQDRGYTLTLEMSPLENQHLIEEIEKMNLDALPKNPRALTSFRDETKLIRDEKSRLEETNERLSNEVNLLRKQLSSKDNTLSSLSESKTNESNLTKNQLRSLQDALDEAKEENNKRISETSQYQQMKKLMQSQSMKIRDLRRRLEKYEPDCVKEDDDC